MLLFFKDKCLYIYVVEAGGMALVSMNTENKESTCSQESAFHIINYKEETQAAAKGRQVHRQYVGNSLRLTCYFICSPSCKGTEQIYQHSQEEPHLELKEEEKTKENSSQMVALDSYILCIILVRTLGRVLKKLCMHLLRNAEC